MSFKTLLSEVMEGLVETDHHCAYREVASHLLKTEFLEAMTSLMCSESLPSVSVIPLLTVIQV